MRVNLGKFTLLVLRTSYSTVVVSIRALWNVYYTVCITTLVVLCVLAIGWSAFLLVSESGNGPSLQSYIHVMYYY